MRSLKPHGYTLVEILVVIAIIGVLVALILAVTSSVRGKSKEAACMSNLHQIGIALSLYRQDYDGMDAVKGVRLSHSQLGLPYHFSIADWRDIYMKDPRILYCPAYHGSEKITGLFSTYDWSVWQSELIDDRDYPGLAALRGEDYPVCSCKQHNARVERIQYKMDENWVILVLRLNGRVQRLIKPVREPTNIPNL